MHSSQNWEAEHDDDAQHGWLLRSRRLGTAASYLVFIYPLVFLISKGDLIRRPLRGNACSINHSALRWPPCIRTFKSRFKNNLQQGCAAPDSVSLQCDDRDFRMQRLDRTSHATPRAAREGSPPVEALSKPFEGPCSAN